MKHREWAQHGYVTSNMMYGCMEIGGSWDDIPIDQSVRQRAFAALDRAREVGFDQFDHADIYCRGKSELIFGEWLSANPGIRDEIVIQSKCGIRPPGFDRNLRPGVTTDGRGAATPQTVVYDFSYEHILGSVENSLRRLGIDHLDILLLHRPDPLMEPEEVARAFDDLHRLGKVRSFGVSNHTAGQIELLNAVLDHTLLVNQVEISLGHPDLLVAGTAGNQRRPEVPLRHNDVVELAMRDGMTIQAWSSLARGAYTGAGKANDPAVIETTALVERLAAEYGTSTEAIVLGWIMRHPAAVVPIVGSTNPERITRSAEASELEISREHWYVLAAAARGMEMP